MSRKKTHRGWIGAIAAILVLGLAALLGTGGCSGDDESIGVPSGRTATTAAAMTTTTAGATTTAWGGEGSAASPGGAAYDSSSESSADTALTGTLSPLVASSGQKIISDAQLQIEVESGKFQNVFNQALLLADRYGGYLVSSQSYASGEEDSMKSGTVAIRVPSGSFTRALDDASRLGTLKNQQIQTQDVTEEYVDLQARIKNSEAYVNSLLALLGKAKTVDETLQVQSVLTYAQRDLEQLRGRLRFLDEHTSYSTITMSIYEVGAEPAAAEGWGVGKAFEAALRNLVKATNAIVRGLGVLIPVLIVLAIIAYVIYRIVRAVSRRNRAREQAGYQPYVQGWREPAGQAGAPGPPVSGEPKEQPGRAGQPGSAPHPDQTAGGPGGDQPPSGR